MYGYDVGGLALFKSGTPNINISQSHSAQLRFQSSLHGHVRTHYALKGLTSKINERNLD